MLSQFYKIIVESQSEQSSQEYFPLETYVLMFKIQHGEPSSGYKQV